MAWRKSPSALIAMFDAAVPGAESVARRKMFGYPAAFANGNLFMGLHQESFILRLPDAKRDKIIAEHGAVPFEPMPGRRMREYVCLPEALLADSRAFKRWIATSLAYAEAIAPKGSPKSPTKLPGGRRKAGARA